MPDWMKQKLESRLLGEISITSDVQIIPKMQKSLGMKFGGVEYIQKISRNINCGKFLKRWEYQTT